VRNKKTLMRTLAFSSAVILGVTSINFTPVKATQTEQQQVTMGEAMTDPVYISEYEPVVNKKLRMRTMAATATASLPTYYRLDQNENCIPAVRNQAQWGTCWAHGTIASLESSLLKQGLKDENGQAYTKDNTDLSERHMAYFTFHNSKDPLGGLEGDSTVVEGKNYLQCGGFKYQVAMNLASWRGAVKEEVAPYQEILSGTASTVDNYNLDSSLEYQKSATLKNAVFVSTKNIDEIKERIMSTGAAAIDVEMTTSYPAYNRNKFAMNNVGVESTNHCVSVIGWDDNFSKENFGNKPQNDGAWIIRNSWGSTRYDHDNGYFYVSYEDSAINRSGAYVIFFEGDEVGKYDHNYQYDGATDASTTGVWNDGAFANRFTVPESSDRELLKAISFGTFQTNVEYRIQVYKNCTEEDPTSGEAQLETPQVGKIDLAGIYTIDLDNPVTLNGGESYSIVVEVTSLSDDKNYVFMMGGKSYLKNEWDIVKGQPEKFSFTYNNVIRAGESFRRNTASSRWEDQSTKGNDGVTPRIKGYTVNVKVNWLGDVNDDGIINYADSHSFASAFRAYNMAKSEGGRYYTAKADLDHDGDIDNDDYTILQRIINNHEKIEITILLGDVDCNGVINQSDLRSMANEIRGYNTAKSEGSLYYKAEADLDQDGDIDMDDYKLLQEKLNA